MTEEFIQYLWKYRLIQGKDLRTSQGQELAIIDPGLHNVHSGPDFCNARLRIGGTLWAGNIEVHVNASDWYRHHHHNDAAYDSVILHVVFNDDKPLYREHGETVASLELKERIDEELYHKYLQLKKSRQWVPCGNMLQSVPDIVKGSWLDRLAAERLERRSRELSRHLVVLKNDWEVLFYHLLARNFGFKVNAQPFEMLARALPLHYIRKNKNEPVKVEALLFGQAGLLYGDLQDEYPQKLKKEYQYLRALYNLEPIDSYLWKFLRLRPLNFPTIRLSQFAGLLHKQSFLFSHIIEAKTVAEIKQLFQVSASSYWENHYTFDNLSQKREKPLGEQAVATILVNTVVPLMFAYGRSRSSDSYTDRSLHLLESLESEDNRIIRKWTSLGVRPSNAARSQALLELHNAYCLGKKCVTCGIGTYLLCRN